MAIDVNDIEPVVSICVITYNHAPYIRECLESLLCQKTTFPYEICLGEDESRDGTREICVEYAEKHPDRIRLLLHSQSTPGRETFIAQGNYNYLETARNCRGRYLAVCEGDDTWLDPLKLQKQFEIMEADPDISLVHSDYDRFDVISGHRRSCVHKQEGYTHCANPDKSQFMLDLIFLRYPIATCTVFMRAQALMDIFNKNEALFHELPMGDIPVWCELLNYGSFHYMDESLGLYRILEESASNSQSAVKKYEFVNGASNLGLILAKKYDLPIETLQANKIKNCNRYAILSGDREEITSLFKDKCFRFSFPEQFIFRVCRVGLFAGMAKKLYQLRYEINNRKSNSRV